MKKVIFFIGILTLMITGFGIYSCQKNNDDTKDLLEFKGKFYTREEVETEGKKISKEQLLSILKEKYDISNFEYISTKNTKEILDPNFTPIMGIIFTNNEKIEILQHKDDNNILKYHKIYNNGKTEQGLFLKDKSVNNVTFSDLKSFHHEEFQSSFCQREEGESQSQCENREYDEFVEDCWVCWIAYHTNPAIPILISAMCLCDK